ncbi:MAG: NUDIX hydrolase [Dermatophilaceae bacterium]
MSGPQLWVRGVDADGAQVVRVALPHGAAPEAVLASEGFEPLAARTVTGQAKPHTLVLEYAVRRADGIPLRTPAPGTDAGLVVRGGEVPRRRQRVAAYALCRSVRGVLLTEFSDRTNAPRKWGLPGGGVDPGELPEQTLHREVHEETGQQLRIERFLGVHDAHWVGRAPTGRLEDFHAVRLVYLAACPNPSDPVVHDVGGTTRSAAWVPLVDVVGMPLTENWRRILAVWRGALSGDDGTSCSG